LCTAPCTRHKARLFSDALGLGADDAEDLREALLSVARSQEAVAGEEDEYGKRYVLDLRRRLPEAHELLSSLAT
jgi:hypothetical protein